ncbi:hypothetical protein ES703_43802 [subsurface metagenome]
MNFLVLISPSPKNVKLGKRREFPCYTIMQNLSYNIICYNISYKIKQFISPYDISFIIYNLFIFSKNFYSRTYCSNKIISSRNTFLPKSFKFFKYMFFYFFLHFIVPTYFFSFYFSYNKIY